MINAIQILTLLVVVALAAIVVGISDARANRKKRRDQP